METLQKGKVDLQVIKLKGNREDQTMDSGTQPWPACPLGPKPPTVLAMETKLKITSLSHRRAKVKYPKEVDFSLSVLGVFLGTR